MFDAVHASPHVPNTLPGSALEVSDTAASPGKVNTHVPLCDCPETLQSIPAGVERIVPVPLPVVAPMVSAAGARSTRRFAVDEIVPMRAVTRAEPIEIGVITPVFGSIVATAGASELHVTARSLTATARVSSTRAVSVSDAPRIACTTSVGPTIAPPGCRMFTDARSMSVTGWDTVVVPPGDRRSGPTVC